MPAVVQNTSNVAPFDGDQRGLPTFRTPPHNFEAEKALLGAILANNNDSRPLRPGDSETSKLGLARLDRPRTELLGQCLERRLVEHRSGIGGKFTEATRPVALVYSEKLDSREGARQREVQIKSWSRAKKVALIERDLETLKHA